MQLKLQQHWIMTEWRETEHTHRFADYFHEVSLVSSCVLLNCEYSTGFFHYCRLLNIHWVEPTRYSLLVCEFELEFDMCNRRILNQQYFVVHDQDEVLSGHEKHFMHNIWLILNKIKIRQRSVDLKKNCFSIQRKFALAGSIIFIANLNCSNANEAHNIWNRC